MSLGKRPRGPMRRTTSMTEFALELDAQPEKEINSSRYLEAVATPRGGVHRRSSGDLVVVETASFLRACGLCKRRLGPGRDIFMYRGEIAFCSLECRQQQMNQDERKAKCSLTSTKKDVPPVTTRSESSNKGETIAAA